MRVAERPDLTEATLTADWSKLRQLGAAGVLGRRSSQQRRAITPPTLVERQGAPIAQYRGHRYDALDEVTSAPLREVADTGEDEPTPAMVGVHILETEGRYPSVSVVGTTWAWRRTHPFAGRMLGQTSEMVRTALTWSDRAADPRVDRDFFAQTVPTSDKEPHGSRRIETPESRLRTTSNRAKNCGDGGI